jgi:hypothetical protein
VIILSLDPGGTTGWAMYKDDGVSKSGFSCGQIGPEEHHYDLYTFLEREHAKGMTVIYEQFEWRPNRHQNAAYGDRYVELISKEYIGVIKCFVQDRTSEVFHSSARPRLVMQTAAEAKGFVKDDNIRKLGLWTPGLKHAMDAYRHMLYYLIKQGPASVQNEVLKLGWK